MSTGGARLSAVRVVCAACRWNSRRVYDADVGFGTCCRCGAPMHIKQPLDNDQKLARARAEVLVFDRAWGLSQRG